MTNEAMLKTEGLFCLLGGLQTVLLSLLYIFISQSVANAGQYTTSVLVTIVEGDFDVANSIVQRYGLKYQRQILPRVHEYEYKPEPGLSKFNMGQKFKAIKAKAANKILDIYHQELIRLPRGIQATSKSKLGQLFSKRVRKRSLSESPHFGMQILDAWGKGYRGDGVVVGVVDTGVEVTHLDLKPNIDMKLSRNFVKGRPDTDVYPDILPSYQEFDIFSDHGNNCAGLIAAIQGNMVCSSGVAPNAKIAALKFLALNDPSISSSIFNFRPTNLVDALTFKSDQIHIYSNSYGPGEDFASSTFVVNEAFRIGATQGRHGKGSIFIIAVGNQGHYKNANLDGYVSSMYTIAISSVGVNGTIPSFVQPGTSIIASTYGEGLNKLGKIMVTTSHGNSCTTEFKRTSASAAIASGIIALALQANHGNNCAGLIAAIQGNMVCSSGVAPNAKIAALKFLALNDPSISSSIFNFRPTNLVDALTFKSDQIHIYSNSYGPGEDFASSTFVVNEAFRIGATQGRHGKGSIFIIAVGNQGHYKNANLDGYVSSMYTIAISSVGVNGTIPSFVQPGTSIIASTYGEGLNKLGKIMVTTSHGNSCTTEFKRTSASAAIASGIIALALQAKSSFLRLWANERLCACGHCQRLEVSTGSEQYSCIFIYKGSWKKETSSHFIDICTEQPACLLFTEHVVAYIEYVSYYDQLVEFQICAPTNTCSFILTKQGVKQFPLAKRETRKWNFMSLQFWGENPKGTWKLMMNLNTSGISTIDKMYSIIHVSLTVYCYSEDSSSKSEIYEEPTQTEFKAALIILYIVLGAAAVAAFFLLPESELHMRQTCKEKCRQCVKYVWGKCKLFCCWIKRLPSSVYKPVNSNNEADKNGDSR